MLQPSDTRELGILADAIISSSLTAMQTKTTVSGRRGKLEVPALKEFLFQMAPLIAQAWRQVVAPNYKMRLTSVLCHQKPMATFDPAGASYGPTHHSRLPATRPMICELADLLVVMEFRLRGRPYVLRQAGLIQAKDGLFGKLSLDPAEYKQHYLLSCWPDFTLPGFDHAMLWRLNGLTPDAARYGLVDPPSGTWTIHSTDPLGPDLLQKGGSFGGWLARLAAGTDGAVADPWFSSGWWTKHPIHVQWADLVDYLLDVTGEAEFQGSKRKQTHKVHFLTAADLGLEDGAGDSLDSWMRFGEVPPTGEEHAGEGPNGISILHIRFDPVDG